MVEEEIVVEGGEGVGAEVDIGTIRESTKGTLRETMKGTIHETTMEVIKVFDLVYSIIVCLLCCLSAYV